MLLQPPTTTPLPTPGHISPDNEPHSEHSSMCAGLVEWRVISKHLSDDNTDFSSSLMGPINIFPDTGAFKRNAPPPPPLVIIGSRC